MHWQSPEIANTAVSLVYERSGNIHQVSGNREVEVAAAAGSIPIRLNPDLAVGEVAAVAVQARLCTDHIVVYSPVVAARHGWDKKVTDLRWTLVRRRDASYSRANRNIGQPFANRDFAET